VQPDAEAWISYHPESTSQWKTLSAAVVSGFVAGSIPGAETLTGVNGPAEVSERKIVTVAPLTGLPFVSKTVPLGSTSASDWAQAGACVALNALTFPLM
jgi:hypothetical protein